MRRRVLMALSVGAIGHLRPALAQRQRIPRIGYVVSDRVTRESSTPFHAFVTTLREHGWTEWKNIEILIHSSHGDDALFPKLAADVLREHVDVIVTAGSPATHAAKAATTSVPIVFTSAANPVELGLVRSLARPGGNITGIGLFSLELGAKRLQLLKECLPEARKFVRLYQTSTLFDATLDFGRIDDAAHTLGIALEHVPVSDMERLGSALSLAATDRADAIIVNPTGMLIRNRNAVAQLALKHRLPSMGSDARFTEAGMLISYGESLLTRYRQTAVLVDKILRGASPAEIPVEQMRTFELVINLNTASKLGKSIPETLLLQADRLLKD